MNHLTSSLDISLAFAEAPVRELAGEDVSGMMMKRHKMEKDLGIGSEVGFYRNTEMAKTSPCPGRDEPEVWDDPRAVVAGQYLGVRQPGNALLTIASSL
ncbi:hypothetical protein EJB05_25946, partial [Eragrostis curvula]